MCEVYETTNMEIDGSTIPQTIEGILENRTNSNETVNENTSDRNSIFHKNDEVSTKHEIQRECNEVECSGDAAESDYSKLVTNNNSAIGFVDDDDAEDNELGAIGIDKNAEVSSDTHEIEIGRVNNLCRCYAISMQSLNKRFHYRYGKRELINYCDEIIVN